MNGRSVAGVLLTFAIVLGLGLIGMSMVIPQDADFEESKEEVTTPNSDPFGLWRIMGVVFVVAFVVSVVIPYMPGQVGGWR